MDSTRRSLRTLYHGLLALLVGVPTWIPLFDTYVAPHVSGGEKYVAFGAVVVAFAAAASKVINKLEDNGLIPRVLKAAPAVPTVVVLPDVAPPVAPAPVTAPVVVDTPDVATVPDPVVDTPVVVPDPAPVAVTTVPDAGDTPMAAGNDQAAAPDAPDA